MVKEKKPRDGHYRDRTICCLACFAVAYVVAGALMASPGIRAVLEYPLFKTGSVIWGGILIFAIGVYILTLSRCMEYLNRLKVAVILIMQIIVCLLCIANIPILKCIEWQHFDSVTTNEDGEVIEDNKIVYIAYTLPLVGTVIGLVSSVFGISYTVIITSRIRNRLKHYLSDLERIHLSSERKMSPISDDATGEICTKQANVSPCSWVFHDGYSGKLPQLPSHVTGLPSDSTFCCEDTVLTSLDSVQDRFMDKRLIRKQPVVKRQMQESHVNRVAIQDYLPHEEKTLIPPNPCLRYDQVLPHPSSRPPSVISIVSNSTVKRANSMTAERIVGETGLNNSGWATVDSPTTPKWSTPPPIPPPSLYFDPFIDTSQVVFNDKVIPAPVNFQDKTITKDKSVNAKCLVPEVIIARPPDPPKFAAVDENDNSVVSAYSAMSTPRTLKHLITFKGNVQAVKPLMTGLESPVSNDISRQGSMCNLMGDPSPMFDMSCTRL